MDNIRRKKRCLFVWIDHGTLIIYLLNFRGLLLLLLEDPPPPPLLLSMELSRRIVGMMGY
jgi:hypothetical protein